ncbi:MAG: hypothetical protein ABI142_14295 [Bryocella sp.]
MRELKDITLREHLKLNLPLQLALLTIVSVIWFFVWLHLGKVGECKPHDPNGECGVPTLVSFVYGLGGAFMIFIGGGVTAIFAYVKRIPPEE